MISFLSISEVLGVDTLGIITSYLDDNDKNALFYTTKWFSKKILVLVQNESKRYLNTVLSGLPEEEKQYGVLKVLKQQINESVSVNKILITKIETKIIEILKYLPFTSFNTVSEALDQKFIIRLQAHRNLLKMSFRDYNIHEYRSLLNNIFKVLVKYPSDIQHILNYITSISSSEQKDIAYIVATQSLIKARRIEKIDNFIQNIAQEYVRDSMYLKCVETTSTDRNFNKARLFNLKIKNGSLIKSADTHFIDALLAQGEYDQLEEVCRKNVKNNLLREKITARRIVDLLKENKIKKSYELLIGIINKKIYSGSLEKILITCIQKSSVEEAFKILFENKQYCGPLIEVLLMKEGLSIDQIDTVLHYVKSIKGLSLYKREKALYHIACFFLNIDQFDRANEIRKELIDKLHQQNLTEIMVYYKASHGQENELFDFIKELSLGADRDSLLLHVMHTLLKTIDVKIVRKIISYIMTDHSKDMAWGMIVVANTEIGNIEQAIEDTQEIIDFNEKSHVLLKLIDKILELAKDNQHLYDKAFNVAQIVSFNPLYYTEGLKRINIELMKIGEYDKIESIVAGISDLSIRSEICEYIVAEKKFDAFLSENYPSSFELPFNQ